MFLNNNFGIVAIVILAIVVVLIIIFTIWYVSTSNKFIRLEQDVQNSESRIDVYLTKRYDLLTKMLDSTKKLYRL